MKNKSIYVLTLCGLILSSCSSVQKQKEAELNAKVHTQQPADSPDAIMQRAAAAFSNAEGLTPEQKSVLGGIYTRVYTESMQIRREMGQSKSLLFMTLAKSDYKKSEVDELKKKIIGLDQKRLKIMFTALDDVQKVVGKGIEAEKIYRHFQDFEVPGHYRDLAQ